MSRLSKGRQDELDRGLDEVAGVEDAQRHVVARPPEEADLADDLGVAVVAPEGLGAHFVLQIGGVLVVVVELELGHAEGHREDRAALHAVRIAQAGVRLRGVEVPFEDFRHVVGDRVPSAYTATETAP